MTHCTQQRLIEVLIGPCDRGEAENVALMVQEHLDKHFSSLGAAVAVDFSSDLPVPPDTPPADELVAKALEDVVPGATPDEARDLRTAIARARSEAVPPDTREWTLHYSSAMC